MLNDNISTSCGYYYTPTYPVIHRLGKVLVQNENSTGIKYVTNLRIQGINRIYDSTMQYFACSVFYEPDGVNLADYLWTIHLTNSTPQAQLAFWYTNNPNYYEQMLPQKYIIGTKTFNSTNFQFQDLDFEIKDKIKLYPNDKIRIVFYNTKMTGMISDNQGTYHVSVGIYHLDFSGIVSFKVTE